MVFEAKDEARAVWALVGLHPLKEGLSIVQAVNSRVEPKVLKRLNARLIPLAILKIGQGNVLAKYAPKGQALPV
jgi:hypothetical protein